MTICLSSYSSYVREGTGSSSYQSAQRRLLEHGVAGELGERAELDDHGAHARGARDRGLPARHAVRLLELML